MSDLTLPADYISTKVEPVHPGHPADPWRWQVLCGGERIAFGRADTEEAAGRAADKEAAECRRLIELLAGPRIAALEHVAGAALTLQAAVADALAFAAGAPRPPATPGLSECLTGAAQAAIERIAELEAEAADHAQALVAVRMATAAEYRERIAALEAALARIAEVSTGALDCQAWTPGDWSGLVGLVEALAAWAGTLQDDGRAAQARIAALEARLAMPWRICPECLGHCSEPEVRCGSCPLGAICPDDARCSTCQGAGTVPAGMGLSVERVRQMQFDAFRLLRDDPVFVADVDEAGHSED